MQKLGPWHLWLASDEKLKIAGIPAGASRCRNCDPRTLGLAACSYFGLTNKKIHACSYFDYVFLCVWGGLLAACKHGIV